MEGAAAAGENLLTGLAGEVAHVLKDGVEPAAVCDPLAVEGGVLGREPAGDGLALFLPFQVSCQ